LYKNKAKAAVVWEGRGLNLNISHFFAVSDLWQVLEELTSSFMRESESYCNVPLMFEETEDFLRSRRESLSEN
jgi:hypothetical protein